jgi:hypothetical protein
MTATHRTVHDLIAETRQLVARCEVMAAQTRISTLAARHTVEAARHAFHHRTLRPPDDVMEWPAAASETFRVLVDA